MKALPIRLPGGAEFKHLLQPEHEWAIRGAVAANRPLLVRGEPGLGKSQLGYAAASLLGRRFISHTITSGTEAQDLLWTFDAVQRLAEAQIAAHSLRFSLDTSPPVGTSAQSLIVDLENRVRQKTDVRNFVLPGPLWWAIDSESAATANHQMQAPSPVSVSDSAKEWRHEDGIVILIDEIDKADSSLPNGLLEIFGARQFQPPGYTCPIASKAMSKSPLVVITTNEERTLPTAFIRRCFVLELELLPCVDGQGNRVADDGKTAFIEYLIALGRAHFDVQLPMSIYREAAEMLFEDRITAIRSQSSWRPGPAEYVDLLCAVKEWEGDVDVARQSNLPKSKVRRWKRTEKDYKELCVSLRRFALQKNGYSR